MSALPLELFGLVVDDLREVHERGLRHPLFGALLDAGSYAALAGVAPGPAGLTELETALRDAPGAPGEHPPRWAQPVPLPAADGARETWERELTAGHAISVVLVDGREREPALLVVAAYGLPCMGAMPPCTRDDAVATWLRLTGGEPVRGRYLLEESPEEIESALEASVTERLRQLYGE